ncbi:SH3 domain-containing protein [Roseococcus sp. SDR]|uniref:SH3 domain-containing protein n=1 Tax=Roseococcus sp. SDR TaxID=2835532 RepID=UPI001BCB9D16|nr:SH3 domain-containing protein [Roseococcus sp. SDR]MBS7791607.1 SH3 domain-containing protein [Roseococcus sp. SDR]MBV1846921.1 SH3 domain-containing protein [Roseococcus sp. SDR]
MASPVTGLPLPRPARPLAEANLRQGPSPDHPVLEHMEQAGLVTVRAECEVWRLVRTADGREAWAHSTTLRVR